jgi:hypothetical protein
LICDLQLRPFHTYCTVPAGTRTDTCATHNRDQKLYYRFDAGYNSFSLPLVAPWPVTFCLSAILSSLEFRQTTDNKSHPSPIVCTIVSFVCAYLTNRRRYMIRFTLMEMISVLIILFSIPPSVSWTNLAPSRSNARGKHFDFTQRI